MLWLMLLHGSSCCDYEFETWDTKNDCFGKENCWISEHHRIFKMKIWIRNTYAYHCGDKMSQKVFRKLEKEWGSMDFPLVFQITGISKIILNCVKVSYHIRSITILVT